MPQIKGMPVTSSGRNKAHVVKQRQLGSRPILYPQGRVTTVTRTLVTHHFKEQIYIIDLGRL